MARVADTGPQRPPPSVIGPEGRRRNKRFLILATLSIDCTLAVFHALLFTTNGPPLSAAAAGAMLVIVIPFSAARGLFLSSLWTKPRMGALLLAVLTPWIVSFATCIVAGPAAPFVFVALTPILWCVALMSLPEAFVDVSPTACRSCG